MKPKFVKKAPRKTKKAKPQNKVQECFPVYAQNLGIEIQEAVSKVMNDVTAAFEIIGKHSDNEADVLMGVMLMLNVLSASAAGGYDLLGEVGFPNNLGSVVMQMRENFAMHIAKIISKGRGIDNPMVQQGNETVN